MAADESEVLTMIRLLMRSRICPLRSKNSKRKSIDFVLKTGNCLNALKYWKTGSPLADGESTMGQMDEYIWYLKFQISVKDRQLEAFRNGHKYTSLRVDYEAVCRGLKSRP